MTASQIAIYLLCVALATTAQSLTGFAFVLILLGLGGVFELAPLADLANVATVLVLANAMVAIRRTDRALDVAAFRDFSTGGALGIVAGVLLLGWLSANVVLGLRLLLGVTVIACAIVVLLESAALPQRSSAWSFRRWGALAGVLTGLFATGGPPLVYQLYRQPMSLKTVRHTLVAVLAVSSIARLALILLTGQFSFSAFQLTLIAAPLVFALSWWFERHPPGLPRSAVLKLICVLLTLTGAGLIIPATMSILRFTN